MTLQTDIANGSKSCGGSSRRSDCGRSAGRATEIFRSLLNTARTKPTGRTLRREVFLCPPRASTASATMDPRAFLLMTRYHLLLPGGVDRHRVFCGPAASANGLPEPVRPLAGGIKRARGGRPPSTPRPRRRTTTQPRARHTDIREPRDVHVHCIASASTVHRFLAPRAGFDVSMWAARWTRCMLGQSLP